jgi:isopenicillin-N N-acyltransferase like protein
MKTIARRCATLLVLLASINLANSQENAARTPTELFSATVHELAALVEPPAGEKPVTITAMNDRKIAIGEMGGRGEGNWDGKPMAQLVREVMEKAATLEEAINIMRKGPRTCEYYFVISDGKTRRAAGIAATPDKFETVRPGESHQFLPHAIKDAVLLSAGERYEKLVERVKSGYGKLDDEGARDLMKRPVCMDSNIHSVLFAPETLDFWVANADSTNPASHTRCTYYNLADLLNHRSE